MSINIKSHDVFEPTTVLTSFDHFINLLETQIMLETDNLTMKVRCFVTFVFTTDNCDLCRINEPRELLVEKQ